jgi:hypothetical protein
MPRIGVVNASNLNFRESPDGAVIRVLPRGTEVELIDETGDFFKVAVSGQTGFVKGSFVTPRPDSPTLQPPTPNSSAPDPAAAGQFRFEGTSAVAPDGTRFAKKFKLGVFNSGQTTIGQFVADHRELFDVAPSRLRVMQAVSDNEGRLEAINTWDNAFLTFGAFQWTVGSGSGAGELPALLARLKEADQGVFDKYFGSNGLDVSEISATPGVTPTGFFLLNKIRLATPAQKEQLRNLAWAYRFWLSGQDPVVRAVQVKHAMGRVDLFYRQPSKMIGQFEVGDYVSSEYGVALLLDQHVNRPGHVPATLAKAVAAYVSDSGRSDPKVWTDADESKLIERYLAFRAQTSMTDSTARANRIRAAVAAGKASAARGSYVS